jgi:hypothetical protein
MNQIVKAGCVAAIALVFEPLVSMIHNEKEISLTRQKKHRYRKGIDGKFRSSPRSTRT